MSVARGAGTAAAAWSGDPLAALLGAVAAQVERAVEADRAGCAALLARIGAGDDAPSGSAPC